MSEFITQWSKSLPNHEAHSEKEQLHLSIEASSLPVALLNLLSLVRDKAIDSQVALHHNGGLIIKGNIYKVIEKGN